MQINWINNESVQLCVETRGRGPQVLLFAHGWISSRKIWYEVCQRLDLSRYTLHLLDFRGSGQSDRPSHGHDLSGYASDLRAVFNWIQQPTLLIGHSAGGKISQYIASHHPPENLKGLVLVAPGSAQTYPPNPRHRQRTLDSFGSRKRIELFQKASMQRKIPDGVMQQLVDEALICQKEAWMGWYDHGRTVDFSDSLSRITCPCVIIAGDQDQLTPEKRVRTEISEKISGSQLVVLRDAGHNLPVEVPDGVAQLIDRAAHRFLSPPK